MVKKRNRIVSFRCTEEEYQDLVSFAKQAGYTSVSQLACVRTLDHAGQAPDPVRMNRRIGSLEAQVAALSLAAGKRWSPA